MSPLRLFWGSMAISVGAVLAFFTLPQTRWIPQASQVVNEEVVERFRMTERVSSGDEDAPELARTLFEKRRTEPIYSNWMQAVQQADSGFLAGSLDLRAVGILTRVGIWRLRFVSPIEAERKMRPLAREARNAESVATARVIVKLCEYGEKVDHGNAFWPLCHAVALEVLGNHDDSSLQVDRAANCDRYNNFVRDESQWKGDLTAQVIHHDSGLIRNMYWQETIVSDISPILTLEKTMLAKGDVKTTIKQRLTWARIAKTLCLHSDCYWVVQSTSKMAKSCFRDSAKMWSNVESMDGDVTSPQEIKKVKKIATEAGITDLRPLDDARIIASEKVSYWSQLASPTSDSWTNLDRPDAFGSMTLASGPMTWLICAIAGLFVVLAQMCKWATKISSSLSMLAPSFVVLWMMPSQISDRMLVGVLTPLFFSFVIVSIALIFTDRIPNLDKIAAPFAALLFLVTSLVSGVPSFFAVSYVICVLAVYGLSRMSQESKLATGLKVFTLLFGLFFATLNAGMRVGFGDPLGGFFWVFVILAIAATSLALRFSKKEHALVASSVMFLAATFGLMFWTFQVLRFEKSLADKAMVPDPVPVQRMLKAKMDVGG